MNWFDKAEEELEQDLADGNITQKEYNQAMRELQAEYREAVDQAGEDARQNYMWNY